MKFDLKKAAQNAVLEPVKKQLIGFVEHIRQEVLKGYVVKQQDVDHLLVAVKLNPLITAFVAPLIVGLNLRDLAGAPADKADKILLRAEKDISGWRF